MNLWVQDRTIFSYAHTPLRYIGGWGGHTWKCVFLRAGLDWHTSVVHFKEKHRSLKQEKYCTHLYSSRSFIVKLHSGSKHSSGRRGLARMFPIFDPFPAQAYLINFLGVGRRDPEKSRDPIILSCHVTTRLLSLVRGNPSKGCTESRKVWVLVLALLRVRWGQGWAQANHFLRKNGELD